MYIVIILYVSFQNVKQAVQQTARWASPKRAQQTWAGGSLFEFYKFVFQTIN
jgi:hypothetical protein